MHQATPTVASITVAWNGTGTITKHLKALQAQTVPLAEIIVVDNNSTDGTRDVLRSDFPQVTVLPLEENLGVGGGFAAGLEYGLRKGYGWFWLFDQDSTAEAQALHELLSALDVLAPRRHQIGIMAPLLVDRQHGFEHVGNLWRDRLVDVPQDWRRSPILLVDTVMSSGSLVSRQAVEEAGLPRADFFMDWVDYEFNLRLRRHGFEIALVRASIVHHRLGELRRVTSVFTGKQVLRTEEPAWRCYFITRNETLVCWHLYGTAKSRFLLVIRLLRRIASDMWHRPDRLEVLNMTCSGFWHGYRRDLTRRGPLRTRHLTAATGAGESSRG